MKMKKNIFGLPMMGISLAAVIVSTLLICTVEMPLTLTVLLGILDVAAALTFSLCPLAAVEKEKKTAAQAAAPKEEELQQAA